MSKKKQIKLISLLTCLGVTLMFVLKFVQKVKKLKRRTNISTVFNSKEVNYGPEEIFDSESFGAMFSAMSIDLTDAIPSDDDMDLNLVGRFSAMTVKVPGYWNVKVGGLNKNSGVSILTEFDESNTISPMLYINYDMKYSALEITSSDFEEEEFDIDEYEPEIEMEE